MTIFVRQCDEKINKGLFFFYLHLLVIILHVNNAKMRAQDSQFIETNLYDSYFSYFNVCDKNHNKEINQLIRNRKVNIFHCKCPSIHSFDHLWCV